VHPGPKAVRRAAPGWHEQEHELSVQRAALRAALRAADRVLLVDDWAENGNQALAARELIEECGAT
jgi:adenine/guanine phosphoribosyltransferase-like PRPP-binding protein